MSAPNFFGSILAKALVTFDARKRNGAIYVADAARRAGSFSCLHAVEAAVVNIESAGIGALLGTTTAVPIPAGDEIEANIQAFTLASGKVVAYN